MIARSTWPVVLALVFPLFPSTVSAQANDNCTNASTLVVGPPGSCPGSAITGNNGGATDSNAPPGCDPSTNGYRDVWYTFNTGGHTEISITLSPGTATDWNYVIYDACQGTELVCVTVPTGTQTYTATPNADFILQIESNLDYGNGGTFQLCIEGNSGGGGTPASDECSTATTLTMGTSCTYTAASALNATVSPQWISCVPAANEDVWFSFVATSTEVNVEVAPLNLMDPVLSLYSGNCANPTILACVNDFSYAGAEYLVSVPVVIGQTYRVRVHDYWAMATDLDFGICVWGTPPPPPPPANDDCLDAITVPMALTCTPVSGDTYGATYGNSNATCVTGSAEEDVWYKFVATGGTVRITVDGGGSAPNGFDPVVRLVFSSNCSSYNEIACESATGPGGTEVLEFDGVNPGTTYYAAVLHAGNNVPNNTTFSICVQDVSIGVGVGERPEPLGMSVMLDDAFHRMGFVLDVSGSATWAVLDVQGRAAASGTVAVSAGAVRWLSLPELSAGVYVLRAYVGERAGVLRFSVW